MPGIQISRGVAALRMLEDPAFCAQWTRLCARCPWSTSYQLPAFAATWYRVYVQAFEPVLVTAQTDTAELSGILCLAASRSNASLTVAGEEQSEYQTWVSDPDHARDFPLEAILALRQEFPNDVIEFRYLPPSVPLDWLADRGVRSNAVLVKKKRPLLRFSDMGEDSLNKANNKKRLKVLKKQGEIEFARITDGDALAAMLDEFAPCYDLRLGAMHGYEPFSNDPLRKQFQLELMKQPSLLHVSILKVGKLLAAAHVNVCDNKQLHLHLICYNPLLAKHSPGKFHIHLLAQMLIADQYEAIDLTPGGDPYKERFANAHDTAHILSFHPTRRSRWKATLHACGESVARRALSAARIHPARARDAMQSLQSFPIKRICSSVAGRLCDRVSFRRAIRLYTKQIGPGAGAVILPDMFQRDQIEHLLMYAAPAGGVSRKQFLSDSLDRLEQGQHLYSRIRDRRLLFAGWLMERPSEVFVSRALPGVKLPADHALVMGLCPFDPQPREDLGSACLAAMLADLGAVKGIAAAMMAVRPDHPAVPILEAAGFIWESSLFAGKMYPTACQSQSPVDSTLIDDDADPVASTLDG
jgi:CelD/BcsL family acetyltransferase involved in cellulose biosynthesis